MNENIGAFWASVIAQVYLLSATIYLLVIDDIGFNSPDFVALVCINLIIFTGIISLRSKIKKEKHIHTVKQLPQYFQNKSEIGYTATKIPSNAPITTNKQRDHRSNYAIMIHYIKNGDGTYSPPPYKGIQLIDGFIRLVLAEEQQCAYRCGAQGDPDWKSDLIAVSGSEIVIKRAVERAKKLNRDGISPAAYAMAIINELDGYLEQVRENPSTGFHDENNSRIGRTGSVCNTIRRGFESVGLIEEGE